MNHIDARQIICQAFFNRFGRQPTRPEAQCVQAVGWLETGYAQYWRPPGNDSWNWGAIQAGSAWSGAVFTYTDTHPNADGSSTPYQIAFRKYPTAVDGANDLVRTVYQTNGRDKLVLPAASVGDTLAFSRGLYASKYYEGFGRTAAERITHHHTAVLNACVLMARAIGEPMPDGSDPPPTPPRVLRLGMSGDDVAEMQGIVGVATDGQFGPKTRTAVVSWQQAHGIAADGVWGPTCRSVARQ